jgi:hypothetical protein
MAQIIKGSVDFGSGFAMRLPAALALDRCLHPTFDGALWENAFLDTGATHSMMTADLIGQLKLQPSGQVQHSFTPLGPCTNDIYRFDIGFMATPQAGSNNKAFMRTIRHCGASEIPSPIADCRLVVGMDILTTTGLVLLPNGEFYLHL